MTELARNASLLVPVERLRRVCPPVDPAIADGLTGVIGQESAMSAVLLGAKMRSTVYDRQHYNIVVVGQPNSGRRAKVMMELKQYAESLDELPPDTLVLHNFDEDRRPYMITVPNGEGRKISKEFTRLRHSLFGLIPAEIAKKRQQRQVEFHKKITDLFGNLSDELEKIGFCLIGEGGHLQLAIPSAMNPEEPMGEDEEKALPPEAREAIKALEPKAKDMVKKAMATQQELIDANTKAYAEADLALIKKVQGKLLGESFADLLAMVEKSPELRAYLTGFCRFAAGFALQPSNAKLAAMIAAAKGKSANRKVQAIITMTTVTVLKDNTGKQHPPVVFATKNQYSALAGRINARVTNADGGVEINHTMIELGFIGEANGGFLVIDLRDTLEWGELAYAKIMETIETQLLAIEGKGKFVDAGDATLDYRPKPLPVNVRFVFLCDRELDAHLREHDRHYANYFRIVAEFEGKMPVADAPRHYAAHLRVWQKQDGLKPFSPMAIAKLVEWGSRRLEDQLYATTEIGLLKDIAIEAAQWAAEEGVEVVASSHVSRALKERFNRQALVCRAHQDFVRRGYQLFQHEGWAVGRINALAVMRMSEEIAMGVTATVTAVAYSGRGRVRHVQKDIDMAGPSNNMAIAVVNGIVMNWLGRTRPLAIEVQMNFEQEYGGTDGDSASVVTAAAAISAITGLPIDQRFAVTGSLNQLCQVQPIGGENFKFEGHVNALKAVGALRPGQAGILPRLNVQGLMLDEEVVEAVRRGDYALYAVDTLDEALELLFGRPIAEIRQLAEKKARQADLAASVLGQVGQLLGVLR